MVYMKYDGDWDVYKYDLLNGDEKKLTNAPGAQGYPAISGRYVVWQDNRDYIGSSKTQFDVYLYDLETGEERKINQHTGYNQSLQIQGNHVVWIDNSDTNYNVYLYDIETGIEKKITGPQAQASGAQISGGQIAWMDGRNGNLDIYTYSLSNGQEKQLTSDSSQQADPKFVGGTTVWHDYRTGIRQVYLYDTASGKEMNISSSGSQAATILAVTDGKVVFRTEGAMGRMIVFDTMANKKYQLIGVPSSGEELLFSDGKMYWKSGDMWQSEPLMNRAVPFESTSSPHASNGAGTESDSWTSINSSGGTVTSPDGRFSVSLPPHEEQQTVKLRIIESSQPQHTDTWAKEFEPITSFYTIEKQGQIAGKLMLRFTDFEEWRGKIDLRKVRLFKQDEAEAKWVPIQTPVTQFDGTVQVGEDELGPFALGYFQMSFSDLRTHWAKEKVEVLAAHHIIRGYENDEYRPDQPVTRAEFVSLVVRAMGWQSNKQEHVVNSFADMQGHWAEQSVGIAGQHGIVQGERGLFRPDDSITREEMIAILMRSLKETNIQTEAGIQEISFVDESNVALWARDSVKQAVALGLIRGKDGYLAPQDRTTRAEAATVVLTALEKLMK